MSQLLDSIAHTPLRDDTGYEGDKPSIDNLIVESIHDKNAPATKFNTQIDHTSNVKAFVKWIL